MQAFAENLRMLTQIRHLLLTGFSSCKTTCSYVLTLQLLTCYEKKKVVNYERVGKN